MFRAGWKDHEVKAEVEQSHKSKAVTKRWKLNESATTSLGSYCL